MRRGRVRAGSGQGAGSPVGAPSIERNTVKSQGGLPGLLERFVVTVLQHVPVATTRKAIDGFRALVSADRQGVYSDGRSIVTNSTDRPLREIPREDDCSIEKRGCRRHGEYRTEANDWAKAGRCALSHSASAAHFIGGPDDAARDRTSWDHVAITDASARARARVGRQLREVKAKRSTSPAHDRMPVSNVIRNRPARIASRDHVTESW